MSGFLK